MAEQVVLLDEDGHATGIMDKAAVHDRRTPLHLAFSCYVFNTNDELLLTQRAHTKTTWPSIWTNTCCGHPSPGEPLEAAVHRRLHEELGLTVHDLELVLPRFRYRAVMANGIVENEMCPVFRATATTEPHPDRDEVAAVEWVAWEPFAADVVSGRAAVSPWCDQQVRELRRLGPDPRRWSPAAGADLPAAAR